MKQTVVEWLVDEMNSIKGSSTNMNGKIQFLEKELNKLYEQAKEMEKEQIMDIIKLVIEKEYHEQTWSKCGSISYVAEQYYNETFKSE
jgi:hypothetical protein